MPEHPGEHIVVSSGSSGPDSVATDSDRDELRCP